MAILPLLIFPDERLKQVSEAVQGVTPEVSAFIDDLLETMRAQPGGCGIAAPQVGKPWRIVIVDAKAAKSKRSQKEANNGLLVLVNPEIVARGGVQIVREGCMSVPDYTANVERAQWVLVDALGPDGERKVVESLGFEAVILQHEIDHLDGFLFIDRVASRNDVFRRKRID